jgi:hypothetical protein
LKRVLDVSTGPVDLVAFARFATIFTAEAAMVLESPWK